MPERLGHWNSQWRRFGTLAAVFRDPDLHVLIPHSTVHRGHPCAAGAEKKATGPAARTSGRSRGGFGTGIRGGVNGLGQPVTLILTAGQESDIGPAEARLAGHAPEG